MMKYETNEPSSRKRLVSSNKFFAGLIVCSLSFLASQFFVSRKYTKVLNNKIANSRLDYYSTAIDLVSPLATRNPKKTIGISQVTNGDHTVNSSSSYAQSINGSNTNAAEEDKEYPRICLDTPFEEPRWEWHYFSQSNSSSPSYLSRKRLLIAQYSGFGKYAKLLELTSPMNKEYARRYHHDIVILQGTTLIMPHTYDQDCTPSEERSMFNKIHLLLMALSSDNDYDQLLILDADTLIYDLSHDITTLMPSEDSMLVAQKLHMEEPSTTSNINNGITLWNLKHSQTEQVARDWLRLSKNGIPDNRPYRGDQYFLRLALSIKQRESYVSAVWNEFYYREGTVIKHFQRHDQASWEYEKNSASAREERINMAVQEVCTKFDIDANALEHVNYTTIQPRSLNLTLFDQQQQSSCIRKKSFWRMYYNKPNQTMPEGRKKLLIAQYSGYDSYMSLLNLTAPINLAYAKEWGHDMLLLKGTAMVLDVDDPCYVAPERAMFNKIPILAHALSKSQQYNQVLVLDTDAMIVDFDFDITTLLKNTSDFLAAHRVDPNDSHRTWNMNIGVSLWDLKHPLTAGIVKKWFKLTVEDMTKAIKRGRGDLEHGDQNFLHRVLYRDENSVRHVNALADEFKYDKGTVVKHFVRQGKEKTIWDGNSLSGRIEMIKTAIFGVCDQKPHICLDIPRF